MRNIQTTGALSGLFLRGLALAQGDEAGVRAFLESQQADPVGRKLLDAMTTKANVPAISTGDFSIDAVARDFIAAVAPFSAIAQLPLRATPYRVRCLAAESLTAAVVEEDEAIPLSGTFDEFQLSEPTVTAAITALTKQQLAAMTPEGERQLAADLGSAVALAEDRQFLTDIIVGQHDFASAGTSVANVDSDLKRALNDFAGDLRRAYWVMPSRTAAGYALLRGSGGASAHPDITARGGTLVGLPVVISDAASDVESSPADSNVYLVDPSRICYADLGAQMSTSTAGTLQMKTDPSYTATTQVSLFQTNTVALRALRYGAWKALSGAVVRINSVDL